jgi:ATP-binding cassette subfamily F protein uup
VERGTTVKVGWFDQQGQDLDPTERVRDAVAGPNRAPDLEQAKLMERFWSDADAQWAPIGTLSGGERRRLQLLLVLTERPNVLLLDEPTNDLDLDTLRALEDFLDGWDGAAIVASHDRTFLDRTVEEVLALDGRGGAALVRGGYAGWRAEHDRHRAEEAAARRAERATTPAAPTARPAKGRSPSTLRRLLADAERSVARATDERDALLGRLAEVGGDHLALAQVGEALAKAEHDLADAEERWLSLAAEAEAAGLSL